MRNQSRFSGEFGNRSKDQGAALEAAEDAELRKKAGDRLDYFKQPNGNALTTGQLVQISTGQDVKDEESGKVVAKANSFDTYARQAAILKAGRGILPEIRPIIDASPNMSASERETVVEMMKASGATTKAPWLGGKQLKEISQGRGSSDAATLKALSDGTISAETLARSDNYSVDYLVETAKKSGDATVIANLKAAFATYKSAPRLSEGVAPLLKTSLNAIDGL